MLPKNRIMTRFLLAHNDKQMGKKHQTSGKKLTDMID